MSQARVLLRNILGDWTGFAVQVLVTFFMTPFVLHTLGDARYGVWAVMMGLTGYYGLLDVGFRSGLNQYLPRYLAVRDFEGMNRAASTGVAALSVCGLIVILACLALSALAPHIFEIPPELVHEVRWGILILGCSSALQFVFAAYSAVFGATQRHDIGAAIGIVTRFVQAGAIYLTLRHGAGLIGLSVATAAVNFVDYLVRWRVAHLILPQLAISLKQANWRSCWEFTSFGLWNVAIAGSLRLMMYTNAIILWFFMPPGPIARFSLAGNLNDYFFAVLRPVALAFFPALVHLDARGERDKLRETYLGGTRLSAVVAFLGAVMTVVWAEPFIRLWVGREYLDSSEHAAVPVLFYLLVGASVLRATQRIGYQMLMAIKRHRLCAALFAAEALLNIALNLALIPYLGLAGSAIGTLIPAVIFQGFIQPYAVNMLAGVSTWEYVRDVVLRAGLAAAVVALAVVGLRLAAPVGAWSDWCAVAVGQPDWVGMKVLGWADLFFRGGVSALVAAICAVLIGLRRDERERFVYRPLGRLVQKVFRKSAAAEAGEATAAAVNKAADA